MGVKRSAITRPMELSLLLHSSVIYSFIVYCASNRFQLFFTSTISSKRKYIHSLTLVFGDLFYAGMGLGGWGSLVCNINLTHHEQRAYATPGEKWPFLTYIRIPSTQRICKKTTNIYYSMQQIKGENCLNYYHLYRETFYSFTRLSKIILDNKEEKILDISNSLGKSLQLQIRYKLKFILW